MKKLWIVCLAIISVMCIFYACKSSKTQSPVVTQAPVKPRILVFTKTKGYHHKSISSGAAAIQLLGRDNNFVADTTADASYFTEDSLKHYSAVIFLSTTMNVLNADQQLAFERYIQAGGGFMGIHAATDTEYEWPWYNRLVGAYFSSHPKQQKAVIHVTDKTHPSTSFLPDNWERFDEWYNFKNVQPDIHVLAYVDETSYEGGQMGDKHPYAWYHNFDGGRAFYTAGGHTNEGYTDSLFLKHLLGGISYAIGNNAPLDYSKAYSIKSPEENRFVKTVLSNDLNEPMELTVAPDGRVFFTERTGKFYVYSPATKKTNLLREFPVKAVEKYLNGLIGITLDPDFSTNNYIYFFYSSSTGDHYHQNVSRFRISTDNQLDTASEKIIIEIPIDLEVSAHTGGSLAWDKNKNLFISTGDNTVPFESDGYAPIDERAGRMTFDAQRSAGNTNDLRGKILRIHPEADGSYTVPEGNLFPKGMAGTRPEIYVMGCRNPYRISVDKASSILYWGEVGPDAGTDSRHGPRGYDEFNQARKAGNYGWPYFVGNSKIYNDSNFATQATGDLFDINGATNNSPNNKGLTVLPPPQKAMIWYPYSLSDEFPLLGTGGRCAMGGPVYHFDSSLQSEVKLPAYYDKALFVYDWMRNWVFAVRLDDDYHYKRMEPFMQTNGDFRRPVDMEIGPDGAIYMLEYGSVYGIDNVDARLVKIEYNEGNRAPIAMISTKDTIGTAPFKVKLNGEKSYDADDDNAIIYEWSLDGKIFSKENKPVYDFQKNGIYTVFLKVSDALGKSSTDSVEIKVGNTLPVVAIQTLENSSFFFNKVTALNYNVNISDKEDPSIDKENIKVSLKYIPRVEGAQMGHQKMDENYNLGKILLAKSDCKACHQTDAKSVGPSFMNISMKYINDKNATGYLANKVITGGGGVWGEHAMSAHPQLSKEEATEIVNYVLSISAAKNDKVLPQQGSAILKEHIGSKEEGRYILTASYTDKGGAITPLTATDRIVLRPSQLKGADADLRYNMNSDEGKLISINNGGYFVLRNIDLKDISRITYNLSSDDKDAAIQVHTDGPKGQLVSSVDYQATGSWEKFVEIGAPVNDPGGKHDLYFVFVKKSEDGKDLGTIDWIRFEGGKEVVEEPVPEKTKKSGSKIAAGKKTTGKDIPAVPKVDTKKKNSPALSAGALLIENNDCTTCHAPSQKLIGPAYMEIAKRYKNDLATVNKLAGKIISGGTGNWGDIPMAPHPQLSKTEASTIVRYILSLKK